MKKKRQTFFNNDRVWIALTGIATLILALVAYIELNESNKTAKENKKINSQNFLEDLKRDFLTKDSREILILIESNQLRFEAITNTFSIFQRDTTLSSKQYFDSISPDKKFYFSNEIDDYLLSHLEDLGKLYKKDLLTLEDIDQDFGYYIETCFQNPQIQKYIQWVRNTTKDSSIYDKLEFIYKELKKKK